MRLYEPMVETFVKRMLATPERRLTVIRGSQALVEVKLHLWFPKVFRTLWIAQLSQ